MAKIQKIRLKDLVKLTSPSTNQPSTNGSTSGSISPSLQSTTSASSSASKATSAASSISTGAKPKVLKLNFADLSPTARTDTRTMLQIDELSSDGRRVKKRALDVSDLSPVKNLKKRREALARGRLVSGDDNSYAPLSDTLLGILQDFSDHGFEFVPDSRGIPDVQTLIAAATGTRSRRRYLTSDQPLLEWRPFADEYLAEMIRNEGRCDSDTELCYRCNRGVPLYRCTECFAEDLVCDQCCRELHWDRPLDNVEKWNGTFFEKIRLRDLGIFVQLGHRALERCGNPRFIDGFTVIHTNGIHNVLLAYCDCPGRHAAGEWRQQLLRRRWFPATHTDPRTAATYQVLNTFHVLTLQGKVTTYDFYAGLEKLSNNSGLGEAKDRYKSFSRMMREWRHLKMAKRSGRGNDSERTLAETRTGEMGIPCIACPRPGVNLPDNWQDAPKSERFLYYLFLAIDACFRLKRRVVSSEKRDPDLDAGGSYFTEDEPFRNFLLGVTDQREMSTCTGLAALDHANTKYSRGYATTGVGVGVCARHEFIQRNGAVDLQKGERYANMDYAYTSLLRHHDPALTKVTSYDIVCQWSKNLVSRVKALPSLVRTNLAQQVTRFVIPKLHIHGHQVSCQLEYSLNWLPGAARTDGEGIERPWAHMGPIATSTRDMGPGARHGTINDHFGHWNWVKLTRLGTLLRKRMRTAVDEHRVHKEELKAFTQGRGADTEAWLKVISEWEEDQERPAGERVGSMNPYEMPKGGMTESDVRLKLAEQEGKRAEEGSFSLHVVGPSALMTQLLEVQELQRQLKLDVAAKSFETAAQKTVLVERRTKIMRLLGRLRAIQQIYMPAAIKLLSERQANESIPEHAEDVPIIFPSDLPVSQRCDPGCRADLASYEEQMRDAQLRTALLNLRTHLHMKSRLLTYRTTNVKAQGMVVKSQSVFKRNQRQIDLDTAKYQDAWQAMKNLRGKVSVGWRKLKLRDVRRMDGGEDKAVGIQRKRLGKKKMAALRAEAKEDAGNSGDSSDDSDEEGRLDDTGGKVQNKLKKARAAVGEGRRHVSWIWMEGGTGEVVDQQVLEDIVRVEWCKSYARTARWGEEIRLLSAEMERCLTTLEYNAKEWEHRTEYCGPLAVGKDASHAEGVRAYALSQANTYRQIAEGFRAVWGVLHEEGGSFEVVEDDEGERPAPGDNDAEMDGASEDEEEQEAEVDGWDDMADIPSEI